MNDDPELASLSSARMIGWGMVLIAVGGVAFAIALREFTPGEPAFWVVAWALVVAASWIVLGVGVTRLAEKIDHLYRGHVRSKTSAT